MQNARVVDIWFEQKDSFGSGYLVTDRLVLTAKHVADPLDLGTRCRVRQAARVTDSLDASLVWTHPHQDIDLALIELDARHQLTGLGPPARFGRVRYGDGVVDYGCTGRGFPRASKVDNQRLDLSFRGIAQTLERDKRYQIQPKVPRPSGAAGWSGFSGTALFSGNLLFAVVAVTLRDYQADYLLSVPITALLADQDAMALLAAAGNASAIGTVRYESYYRELRDRLDGQYLFLDRQKQVKLVEDRLAAVRPGDGDPVNFVMGGSDDDAPDLLIRRVATSDQLREVFGDIPPDQAIALLDWPGDFDLKDADAELAALKQRAAAALGLPGQGVADAATFALGLHDRLRVAGLWWSIAPNRMGRNHAVLLDRWFAFVREVQVAGAPLVCFLCVLDMPPLEKPRFAFLGGQREPDKAAIEEMVGGWVGDGALVPVDELPSIEAGDVKPWIKHLTDSDCLAPDDGGDLQERIADWVGGEMLRLRQFKARVREKLGEAA